MEPPSFVRTCHVLVAMALLQALQQIPAQSIVPGRRPVFYLPDLCTQSTFQGLYGVSVASHHEGAYTADLDCTVHLSVTEGYLINITFYQFDLEPRVGGRCTDFVQFYNGHGRELLLTEELCGGQIPPAIISNSSNITLRYRTDGTIERTGFKFLYDRVHRDRLAELGLFNTAEGLVRQVTGQLQSGGYSSHDGPDPWQDKNP